jgi:predicted pyridoxine 5'-phosphate oxidase superfamily flavin-nucleotide-binding protein
MIPDGHGDLLARPLVGHLATLGPDGTPPVDPMWFTGDGTDQRFTVPRVTPPTGSTSWCGPAG